LEEMTVPAAPCRRNMGLPAVVDQQSLTPSRELHRS